MRMIAYLICWSTLWVDVCLFFGVLFAGKFGSGSLSAVINFGLPISSENPAGSRTIVILATWTGVLAIGCLYALARSKPVALQFEKV